MEDYLYLDDNINLYSKKNDKINIVIPYKDTLKEGRIVNKEKFIKKFSELIKDLKINNNFFNNSISVIINNNITLEDKEIIKDTLEILNYKKIKFIREINYLALNKDKLFISYNNSYFYFYSINYKGNTEMLVYDNNRINKELIVKIIKLLNKKKIYVFGKNYNELITILNDLNLDYYYFENSDNLILNLVIKKL